MDLSIPANNLQCGIAAFESGADSIYFGLSEFSARKGAENFSFDDFLRIKEYAVSHNKKIYIAFNTIISDSDIDKAYHLLKKIDFIGVDGLIVQDLGIVNLCKREFSNIPLHASTQMAVLNTDGVKALKKLGFKRVVLARELSLSDIKKIRNDVKDVELKVFVHGALCYCISGLCYASFALTEGKTSANRGSCAGICRWPFKKEGGSFQKNYYPFSLSDVESDKKIISELNSIGIDAIKIEGRLKNSLYASASTKYYRSILDKKSTEEIEKNRESLECAFARKTSNGYFYENKRDLDCSTYTGHRGYKIGTFFNHKQVKLSSPIYEHDGLFYLDENNSPQKLASPIKKANRGDTITIKDAKATKGSILYKTKKSDENEKSFNKNAYPLYLKKIPLHFIIENECLTINERSYRIKIEKAREKQNLKNNFENMFITKEGFFTKGEIDIINKTDIKDDEIFIPLSALKKIKNDFYENENKKLDILSSSSYKPIAIKKTHILKSQVIFHDDEITINNIADLLPFLNSDEENSKKYEQCNITISPLMNTANRETINFFEKIFKNHNLRIMSSLEECPTQLNEYLEDRRPYLLKETPLFTSLSQIPENGIYSTQFRGKTYTVKVIRENGLVKTYLV